MIGVFKFNMLRKVWSNYHVRRYISRSAFLKDSNKPVPSQTPTSSSNGNVYGGTSLKNEVRPSDFEKWMLVFCKRYKSKEDIPPQVSIETIKKVHSQMRIKIANLMILITLGACGVVIYTGKKKVKEREDFLQKAMLEQGK